MTLAIFLHMVYLFDNEPSKQACISLINMFEREGTVRKKVHIRDRICPNTDRHTWSVR